MQVLQQIIRWDEAISRRCYFSLQYPGLIRVLQAISWLGDGAIWVVLAVGLPVVYGAQGIAVTFSMLLAAIVNVVCFRPIKDRFKRLRPFNRFHDIEAKTKAGGQYGFPSSHTIHAVSFLVALVIFQPALGGLMGGVVVVIALSRVILGVHYFGDIICASVLGGLSGGGATWVVWSFL